MDLSVMFFSAGEGDGVGGRYRHLLDVARFADERGFRRVWLPERHFAPFGALHPNPAVIAAALAGQTARLRLAAGSVVLPLHNPLRVAEDWAVVDNLSAGRVDVSFASGWHPADFALMPEHYPTRHAQTRQGIELVHRLWRGETVHRTAGDGRGVAVRTYPTPVQPQLPTWVTAARNVETFRLAGELGANVLTYLVDLELPGLATAIAAYRDSRAANGHDPRGGTVTVMLHTLVDDGPAGRSVAREHYWTYLRNNIGLLDAAAVALGRRVRVADLAEAELDALVEHQFQRVFGQLSFMGGRASCVELAGELAAIGVAEVACLLDFVQDPAVVLAALPALDDVRDAIGWFGADRPGGDRSEVGSGQVEPADRRFLPEPVRRRLPGGCAGAEFYQRLRTWGGDYGPAFQAIEQVWFHEVESLARLRSGRTGADSGPHPAEVDNVLLTLAATALAPAHLASGYTVGLPRGFDRLRLLGPAARCVWSHAVLRPGGDAAELVGDVHGYAEDGRLILAAQGMRFDRVATARRAPTRPAHSFGVVWERQAPPVPASPPTGAWLILTDDADAARALVARRPGPPDAHVIIPLAALTAPGGLDSTVSDVDSTVSDVDSIVSDVDGSGPDPGRLREAVRRLVPAGRSFDGGACLLLTGAPAAPGTDPDELVRLAQGYLAAALALSRTLLDAGTGVLRIVTRGGLILPGDRNPPLPVGAVLWGLGRTLAWEHPTLRVGLVDVSPAEEIHIGLVADLLSAAPPGADRPGADQRLLGSPAREWALRGGECWVPRLWPTSSTAAAGRRDPRPPIHPDRGYLISGGTGALGRRVAAWLAACGARHLVLLSRRGAPARAAAEGGPYAVANLARFGVHVHQGVADVADPEQVAAALDAATRDGCPPLAGVLHLAGEARDAATANLDTASLHSCLRAKVAGALVLTRATAGAPLDFFLSFGSVAGLAGSPGQGGYAAANAFLDSYAAFQRAQGTVGSVVDWGPWEDGAMRPGPRTTELLARAGIGGLSDEAALAGLADVLAGEGGQVVVVGPSAVPAPAPIPPSVPTSREPERAAVPGFQAQLRELATLAPLEQLDFVLARLSEVIADLTGVAAVPLRPGAALVDAGVDSLLALELRDAIQHRYGVALPIHELLAIQNLQELAEKLVPALLLALTTADPTAPAAAGPAVEVVPV